MYQPVREQLGLDKLRPSSSGAAALPLDALGFLAGFGIEIQEVCGLAATTVALTVLDEEAAPRWAVTNGLDITAAVRSDLAALAAHPEIRTEIERAVAAANARLARVKPITRYRLLQHAWTPERGELTPTLKLNRRVIAERYAPTIAELYVPD